MTWDRLDAELHDTLENERGKRKPRPNAAQMAIPELHECDRCAGTGRDPVRHQDGEIGYPCRVCAGSGSLPYDPAAASDMGL